mmetsp:Transcript_28641/g.71897  ORF Transcript_28641/g.71897 Transcript_28641/m.71897 type:complete len:243 (+) Transcript_28641:549-1277(+)
MATRCWLALPLVVEWKLKSFRIMSTCLHVTYLLPAKERRSSSGVQLGRSSCRTSARPAEMPRMSFTLLIVPSHRRLPAHSTRTGPASSSPPPSLAAAGPSFPAAGFNEPFRDSARSASRAARLAASSCASSSRNSSITLVGRARALSSPVPRSSSPSVSSASSALVTVPSSTTRLVLRSSLSRATDTRPPAFFHCVLAPTAARSARRASRAWRALDRSMASISTVRSTSSDLSIVSNCSGLS